jgi:hypothetical protein
MSFYFDPFLGCLSNIAVNRTPGGATYFERWGSQ